MPTKTLHREDVEKLVRLVYTQFPNFTLMGSAYACRASKFGTFVEAVGFLTIHADHIIYLDQQNHYEDEPSIGEADAFVIRYADLKSAVKEAVDEVDPEVDKRAKTLEKIRNLVDIQGQSGNWNCNKYMHGMFNGMELILSMLENRPVRYKDAPTVWLDDIPSPNHAPVAEQQP